MKTDEVLSWIADAARTDDELNAAHHAIGLARLASKRRFDAEMEASRAASKAALEHVNRQKAAAAAANADAAERPTEP